MKKISLYWVLCLMMAFSVVSTSCSKDDDDNASVKSDKEFASVSQGKVWILKDKKEVCNKCGDTEIFSKDNGLRFDNGKMIPVVKVAGQWVENKNEAEGYVDFTIKDGKMTVSVTDSELATLSVELQIKDLSDTKMTLVYTSVKASLGEEILKTLTPDQVAMFEAASSMMYQGMLVGDELYLEVAAN